MRPRLCYNNGNRVLSKMDGKVDIMNLMTNNPDTEVQKHALLCVQKMMVRPPAPLQPHSTHRVRAREREREQSDDVKNKVRRLRQLQTRLLNLKPAPERFHSTPLITIAHTHTHTLANLRRTRRTHRHTRAMPTLTTFSFAPDAQVHNWEYLSNAN
jgi:hypothetical protein